MADLVARGCPGNARPTANDDVETCAICMDPLVSPRVACGYPDQRFDVLPLDGCGHPFHFGCIHLHVLAEQQRDEPTCPTCRGPIDIDTIPYLEHVDDIDYADSGSDSGDSDQDFYWAYQARIGDGLHRAADRLNVERVKKLLATTADLDAFDANRQRPIDYVVEWDARSEGIHTNFPEAPGVYSLARLQAADAVFDALLDAGASATYRPAEPNNHGHINFPLMFAVQNDHVHMARRLIEAGADKEVRDEHGRTVLFLPCSSAMMTMLLEHGCDPLVTMLSSVVTCGTGKTAAEHLAETYHSGRNADIATGIALVRAAEAAARAKLRTDKPAAGTGIEYMLPLLLAVSAFFAYRILDLVANTAGTVNTTAQ